ncbi:MAG: RseA family anti-sigma factor [Pseudomonadota bacterium]
MDINRGETLSALLDGELDADACTRMVDRLLEDTSLQQTWERFHLVGDGMRGGMETVELDLAQRVSTRLAEEPTVLAPHALKKHRHAAGHHPARFLAGMALAAGVSAVAVLGVMRWDGLGPDDGGAVVATAPVAPAATLVESTETASSDIPGPDAPEVSDNLSRYLVNHSEFASGNSLNSIVPLTSFVSYDE